MNDDARYPDGVGFTWGETETVVWLAGPDGGYKKIAPELLEALQDLATGERQFDELSEEAREAIRHLEDEAYVTPGGAVTRHETPAPVRVGPRVALFVAAFVVVTGVVLAQLLGVLPGPEPNGSGALGQTAVAIAVLVVLTLCHEGGHYLAARPYFKPGIRVTLINWVFPAIVTQTNDAWRCPRSVRIWINIAGPLVDALLTVSLAAVYVLVYPESVVLSVVVSLSFFRLVFAINPLIQGDGYWILVDWLGSVNLRRTGFTDLRDGKPTGPAAYAVCSVLFSLLGGVLLAYFAYQVATGLL